MITPALQAEIEREIKKRIVAIAPLSAANYAQIYRLGMEGGLSLVAKVAERGLDDEAFMLRYLREKSKLAVPAVFFSNEHVIIMEFVETHYSADDKGYRDAAEQLAALHKITAPMYGFERDTRIGYIRQPNAQTKDWVAFFSEHRLLYMAKNLLDDGKIDAKLMKQFEKLAAKMPSWIKNPGPPALVHGDVWSGNTLFGRGKVAAFLDPAIYYADAEMELASIKALNSFSETFFSRYNDLNPIAPGFFEERADIYSLYPLLIHTRLFGTSYLRPVKRILDKFVG